MRPDELHVHVHHGHVTVEGKHEEKSHDGNRTVSRLEIYVFEINFPKYLKFLHLTLRKDAHKKNLSILYIFAIGEFINIGLKKMPNFLKRKQK